MADMSKEAPTPAVDQIVVGDCIKLMNSWPAGSADLIFADPPYNIGYEYDQYQDTKSDEEYVTWTQAWIDGCVHLLKPTGSFYILIGDEYAAETRMHLKKHEREGNLLLRNWIIWHYTFGQNCKLKFNRSHAHLFYCVGSAAMKKPTKPTEKNPHSYAVPANVDSKKLAFTFNREAIAVASARQTTYGDLRANPKGKVPDDTWYLRPQEARDDIANGSPVNYFTANEDTWYESRLCGTFSERVAWHPCQLPESLLERIVKVSSNEGDLVFDPFSGSGTTAAVAARLKRHWLATDISKDYATKAQERALHAAATGETLKSSQKEKGILDRAPKKKPEPKRSKVDQVQRQPQGKSLFAEND